VGLHRVFADHELLGDALVGVARDEQREHFGFPLGEPLVRAGPELAGGNLGRGHRDPSGQRGVDDDVTLGDPVEVAHEFVGVDPLEDVPLGAGPERLEEVVLVVVHGEHDDLGLRVAAPELRHDVEPAVTSQPHIAQDDVGPGLRHQPVGGGSRRRSTDDRHLVGEVGKHRRKALQHHLVVVDEDQA